MSLDIREAASLGSISRWRRLAAPAGVAAVTAVASTYLFAVDPNQPGHYPTCFTYALTGIYCPGCGMLRATHALVHGDLATSFALNPLFPPLALLAVLLFVAWVRARWQGRALTWNPPRATPWLLAAGFVTFTVLRNIPGFEFLGPGA